MVQILTGDWNNKQGSEVRGIIQGAINEIYTLAKEKAKDDIDISVDDSGQDVTLSYTKADGLKYSKTITVKPASKASMSLTLKDYVDVFGYGKDLKIPFEYEVTDNGVKVAGLLAVVEATIKLMNGALVKALKKLSLSNTVKTSSGTNREGTLTIPGSELFVGSNRIEITFTTEYNGVVSATLFASVEAINLSLSIGNSLGTKYYYDVFTATDDLTFSFINTGTAKPVITSIYYGDYFATSTDTNTITVSIANLKLSALTNGGAVSSMNTIGRQRLFIQSKVKDTDIKSNIVMFDLISASNGINTFSGVAFSTMLNVLAIDNDAPAINANQYDEVNIPIYYYASLDGKVLVSLNGTELSPNTVLGNSDNRNISFSTNFKVPGNQSFSIYNVNNIDLSLILDINVLPSGSSIAEPSGLELSLDTKNTTPDTRDWKYNLYSTTFSNFDWSGNGFISKALIFNSGASAIIDYAPCTSNAYTISFKFSTTNSLTDECLIWCKSQGTGFEIYPEKIIMYNNGLAISTEFSSNLVHEFTLVSYGAEYQKLMNIYIDGSILACTVKSELTHLLEDNYIHIKANNALLNLYAINAFKRALTFTEVLSLYCLNLSDSKSITDYIKENDVFDNTIVSDYMGDKVKISKLPVGARYLVLESYKEEGKDSLDPEPWKTINGYITDNPETYKGIRHLLGSIKLIVKTEDGSAHKANFYAERATLSAQGTSSMAYPAKNFRIYFKKAIDKTCPYYNEKEFYSSDAKKGDFGFTTNFYTNITPNFDPKINTDYTSGSAKYSLFKTEYLGDEGIERDSAPAKLFCLKADFAESSGTHNTGFARLVNYALTKSTNICPDREVSHLLPMLYALLLAGSNAKTKTDIRSTIDGRPVYLFVKHSGEDDDEAIFYGKYNMNNEKSSEDVFGFTGAVDYYSNETVQNESLNLAELFNDYDKNFEATHFKYGINNNKYIDDENDGSLDFINPNECWEFSNNTFNLQNPPGDYTNIGAFLYPYTPNADYPLYTLYKNYNPFTVKGTDGSLAWLCYNDKTNDYGLAWEYRFPGLETEAGKEDDGHKKYKEGLLPHLLGSLYKWLYKHNSTLWEGTKKSSMLSEFAKDLHLYFNVNYLLKYYVLTKIFGNTDQRIKNCMLSFYCDPTALNNTNSEYPMGHMRAFYIFYDNDTILGVDNAGALSNPWNMDENSYPGYGKHAIWDNLEACYKYYIEGNTSMINIYNLGKLVEDAYVSLRKVITDSVITKYFELDLVQKYCDAIYNVDAEIKYFYPKRHMTLLEGASVDEPNRVSSSHGNRKFHRNRWIGKRLNWFDAKFGGGNISLYNYQFKVQGAEGSGDGGTVALTSALNDWRFYATSAKLELDTSRLLKAGELAILNIGNISVSDHINLTALYACSEIDISGFNTATYISDLVHGNVLPYLKNLIINTSDSLTKYITTEAMLRLVSASICPNLEKLYIANIKTPKFNENVSVGADDRFGTIDLSSLNKLLVIDVQETAVDITLPNSPSLTTLYLQNPTKLVIKNKPNLSTFSVASIDDLTSIEIGEDNKKSVNEVVLAYAITKLNSNKLFSVTVNYGSSTINNNELAFLELLADAKLNGGINVVVRGNIVNRSATSDQLSKFRQAFGSSLIVSDVDTGEFKLTLDATTLREGETLTVSSNKLLDSEDVWTWAIDGETKSNLNNTILVDKTDSSITFTALPTGYNNNDSHYLVVTATSGTTTVSTNSVLILYVPISSISIYSDLEIIDTNADPSIFIRVFPLNHTKSNLLADKITWSTQNGNVDGDYINGYTWKLALSFDGSVVLRLADTTNSDGNIITSNTLKFIYDKKLVTISEESGSKVVNSADNTKESSKLYWIWCILFNVLGLQEANLVREVKISTLKSLDLSTCMQYIPSLNSDGVDMINDLEYLLYFNYSNNTFTIPNKFFTNLSVPEVSNISTVTWTLNDAKRTDYSKVKFNSLVQSINVTINSTSGWLKDLVLDMSDCVNITKICNNGSLANGVANIKITYTALDVSTPEHGLFVYPPNLKELGNIKTDDSSAYPNVMFNLINADGITISESDSKAYNAFYPIDDPNKNIKVGAIYGYPIANGDAFRIPYNNITDTYYTFYRLKTISLSDSAIGLAFNNIKTIGSGTFASPDYSINITLNGDITYIGQSAFENYTGNIISTNSNNGKNIFNNIYKIDSYAFSNVSKSLVLEFNSASLSSGGISIGAFALSDTASEYHLIYITGSTVFNYHEKSFGVGKKNSLYISSELLSVMSLASATWELLKKNVKIFVDGSQIN